MTKNVKKSMQKVYLAGKCDPDNDWRGYFSADYGPIYSIKNDFWTDHHFEHRAGFICTGPFPTNAKGNHSCEVGSPHSAIGIAGGAREHILSQCLRAIEEADLVFAYIDTFDAHGTLVEIGYAKGIGKPVCVCFPKRFHQKNSLKENQFEDLGKPTFAGDLWFAAAIADEIYFDDIPLFCLQDILHDKIRRA